MQIASDGASPWTRDGQRGVVEHDIESLFSKPITEWESVMEFVPDRSFAYRFSRYEILPELQQLPEVQSGDSFLRRELAWPLIDSHLTQEQQSRHLAANGSTQPLPK